MNQNTSCVFATEKVSVVATYRSYIQAVEVVKELIRAEKSMTTHISIISRDFLTDEDYMNFSASIFF